MNFFQGASLPDPHELFNAELDAKKTRAIDFYENDKTNESELKDLIRSAVAHNRAGGKDNRRDSVWTSVGRVWIATGLVRASRIAVLGRDLLGRPAMCRLAWQLAVLMEALRGRLVGGPLCDLRTLQ